MPAKVKFRHLAVSLVLLGYPLLSGGQTSKPTLDAYISQSVVEANNPNFPTVEEWIRKHPDDIVQTPADKGSDYGSGISWDLKRPEQQEKKLQGRWCLRSNAEIDLAEGIHVRRFALFYQPLAVQIYGKPLPPLPTETGDALRNHGCRLVRILHEFEGVSDPQGLVETIAKQLLGRRVEEPGRLIEFARDVYWNPVYSIDKSGDPFYFHFLFVRNPKVARPEDRPAVLLEWQGGTLDYGQPEPDKTINPEAGQPWLAIRAAMLARLPSGPTLDMLSFLAPQVADHWEQAPLHCHKQLIPVVRTWLDLAAQSGPEQHTAAILLADQVLGRLGDCQEFSNTGLYVPPEEEKIDAEDNDALIKELQGLDIQTVTSAHLGNTDYTGNLLEKALKLAPEGAASELAHMAALDRRCRWDFNADATNCTDIIKEGESFLSHFPADEWTPSVHLILAEAYTLTAANPNQPYAPISDSQRADWQKKAAAHYRAWYAKSTNERDRALVWEEIWAIDAGMGTRLMLPFVLQQ
jgi:hypothetical protein